MKLLYEAYQKGAQNTEKVWNENLINDIVNNQVSFRM